MILASRRRYSNGDIKCSSSPTSVWNEPCVHQAEVESSQVLLFLKQRINNYRVLSTEKLPTIGSFKEGGSVRVKDIDLTVTPPHTHTHSSEMGRDTSHVSELLCHRQGLSYTFEEVMGFFSLNHLRNSEKV